MSWFGCSWVMGMSAWWDLTPAWESVLSAPNCTRWFIGLQPLADEGDTTRLSRADHKQFARSTCFLYFELSCSLKKTKKPSAFEWHCTVTVRPSVNSAWEHIYFLCFLELIQKSSQLNLSASCLEASLDKDSVIQAGQQPSGNHWWQRKNIYSPTGGWRLLAVRVKSIAKTQVAQA